MPKEREACCSSPASICYWLVASLVARGVLSLIGIVWHPQGAAAFGFKGAGLDFPSEPTRLPLNLGHSRNKTAHFLFIQTRHVTGPASSLVMARPASFRASLIWP